MQRPHVVYHGYTGIHARLPCASSPFSVPAPFFVSLPFPKTLTLTTTSLFDPLYLGESAAPAMPRRRLPSGDPPVPDDLRCRRADGRQWRCPERALPGISFCEHHHRLSLHVQSKRKPPKPRRAPRRAPPPPPPPPPPDPPEPEVPDDQLRCRRTDGRRWRCSARALPGLSFCEHHDRRIRRNSAQPPPSPEHAPLDPAPRKRRRRSEEHPAAEEAATQRHEERKEGKKRRMTSEAAEEAATPEAKVTRDLPNGVMVISSTSPVHERPSGPPLDHKLGFEPGLLVKRPIRSKNVEPVPVATVKVCLFPLLHFTGCYFNIF